MRSIRPRSRRSLLRGTAVLALAGLTVAAAGCAPSSAPADGTTKSDAAITATRVDKDFDLNKLVAAAKEEGSVTVYDSTGDVVEAAAAFTKKYGIKAVGVKSKVGDTLQKMTREAAADNVTIDATLYEDGPTFVGELLPQKVVYPWLPGDLVDDIAAKDRTPPQVLQKANVFAYNPKLYPAGCPVHNVWELTDPKWRGKVVLQDPLGKPNIIQLFTQLDSQGDALGKAYRDEYGTKPSGSPAQEWIKKLAANAPILTSSDGDSSAAVGAPNQTKRRIGLFSTAKFRDVKDKGYHLRACEGLQPWSGYLYPKYVGIATHTRHPNAAKLFVHFMYTEAGIGTEMHNGGISANRTIPVAGGIPGLTDWHRDLFAFDSAHLRSDYRKSSDMQDLWRLNHH
ncbi:ABC transporter substrate-binding protein [Actinocatenispora comari]|uniref:ABC transporter substrate-binding protein n=1 Tax=Actinocatenispora comari TaxID=2807577 RepID=A0A8J4AG24_9ACTN|nr:ABC transporter substrate-binding protein [Actinocatenispora comari]GIL29985.1 ABC transporter substrate-binding protein [Actinocatenispora comari]